MDSVFIEKEVEKRKFGILNFVSMAIENPEILENDNVYEIADEIINCNNLKERQS